MKRILAITAAAALLASCGGPEGEKAKTTEAATVAVETGLTYTLDSSSKVEWKGTKPVGTHHGTIGVSAGSIGVDNGNITGGNFVLDLNTLTDLDLKAGEGKEKLEGHLKSADFFDVAKFPTAKFEIVSVTPLTGDSLHTNTISGNLTIKDSTKNITFPALIKIDGGAATVSADFNIDRTQWGLFYGNDKSLGDKFIHPEVNIKFDLKASK